MKLSIRVGEGQDAVIVARNLSFDGGVLLVISDAEDMRNLSGAPHLLRRTAAMVCPRERRWHACGANAADYPPPPPYMSKTM